MRRLIDTLAERRRELAERGSRLATATRDRGMDALGKVRDGTLDWHKTLLARRAAIDSSRAQPRWMKLDGVQMFVLDRFDQMLGAFAERVRQEIERLGRFELAGQELPPKTARKVAKAKKAPRDEPKPATRRLVLPIADYDALTAKEVIAELGGLSAAHRKAVRRHEAANKKRKTVLEALDARLA